MVYKRYSLEKRYAVFAFTPADPLVRAILADREREAQAIARRAEAAGAPRGLRAGFAARLARLALRLDGDAARFSLQRDAHPPTANWARR